MTQDRLPPFDNEAEESLIAALMVDDEAPDRVADIVATEDFYRDTNRWTFDACMALHRRGESVNQVTVAHELSRADHLEDAGGLPFLARLTSELPTPIGVEHYAGIVHRDATYRRMIQYGAQVVAMAYAGGPDLEGVLQKAEAALQAVSNRSVASGPASLAQILDEFWQRPGVESSLTYMVRTGYPDLDAIVAGLRRGGLITVAARTSLGKSAFALNLARNAAVAQNLRSLVFSLEMGRDEWGLRALAHESGIDSMLLRLGEMNENEERRAMAATGEVSAWPVDVDDAGRSTIERIRTIARRHKAQQGLDMVIVDYLQLVSGSARRSEQNRVQEVSEVSSGLKQLARELDVPVVAAAQLSRQIDYRKGKDTAPRLADLRESGSIEQDSDVVMFLHKPPKDGNGNDSGLVKIIVAKNRGGPRGECYLRFVAATSRFEAVMAAEPEQAYGQQPAPWA